MRDIFFTLGTETRNYRQYALGILGLCVIMYLAVIGLVQVVSAENARAASQTALSAETRAYSIPRSIVGVSAHEGFKELNNVRLDPCKKS